ncbi:hypothetical protein B932_3725 (plasmid) [Gluconobacter oxydans H24]|nr:hypothetical protein B932_3725 [Gluconobacter oxydans H24]
MIDRLSTQKKHSRQAVIASFLLFPEPICHSRMQTSALATFRFICINECDTYVYTRKEA